MKIFQDVEPRVEPYRIDPLERAHGVVQSRLDGLVDVAVAPQTSIYGLSQLPLHQRVHGIQLTAKASLYVGISRGIL